VIGSGSVNDDAHTIFDVIKSFETSMEILNQLRKLIGSSLTDMTLINDQHNLDVSVQVEESLNEEGVRNFILFTLVVFEPGAIIEGHSLNDYFCGDGGLGVFFVTNFDL